MARRHEIGMFAGFVGAVLAVSAALLLLFGVWGRATALPAAARGSRHHLLFTGWGGTVEQRVFTQLVAEFERRNPDIDVEYRAVPRDYIVKLKLMFAGGSPPDVFYIPDGDFPGFAVAHRLVSLQPYVNRSSVVHEKQIWDAALSRYRFDGRVFGQGPLYALPKDVGPTAMYVNLDLLRASGVQPPPYDRPLTWDEAVPLWKRLTRDMDGDGHVEQWGTHGMVLEAAVWSNGGDFLSADGRRFTMADDPKAVQAAEWLAGLQTAERVAPQQRQRDAIPVDMMFLTGRLATFIGGRWMVPQFREADFDWDVVPIPVSPATHKQAGWSGSVGLAISPSCPEPDAAWKLIEFLSGPEGQAVQAQTGFQIPNQRSLSHSDIFLQPGKRPAHSQVFVEAAEYEQANPPTHTPNGEWFDTLIRKLDPVYRGEISMRDALRGCREEVQEKLDRGWKVLTP